MLQSISPLLTFPAFILLLFVSLSTPIIKSIHLFSVTSELSTNVFGADVGVSGYANFGVWGYCTSNIEISGVSDLEDTISKVTTAALVLHPIACGLTFLAFLVSVLMVCRGRDGPARLPSICSLLWGIFAAVLTTAVFLIDIIFVAIVRNKVRDKSDDQVDLHFDAAIWMVLAAAVALWVSLIGGCCGVCACGGR
uniref:Pali-domain-containing protein n=2 Tax=Schizophyllum commune (strain H4-8 / FGSC 9210) TaxID=578458 RepID=D8PWX6_SCHCM